MIEWGVAITLFLAGLLVGTVLGQLSVWRGLRKHGQYLINEWVYSAKREVKA